MLTDGSGGNASGTGNAGDNLLEELNRDAENQENADYDNHANIDEKQAWLNSQRYIFVIQLIVMSLVSSKNSK